MKHSLLLGLAWVLGCGLSLGQTQFNVLYTFSGGTDGGYPFAGLVRDEAGNLYGATGKAGAAGCGVVFALNPENKETVLQAFDRKNGCGAEATLTLDQAGNLYGTTIEGGSFNNGTVFLLDKTKRRELFYSFPSRNGEPISGVVRDRFGNVYGTTRNVAFELTAKGKKVLHVFPVQADSSNELLIDLAGNLYGTTIYGGAFHAGTVFEIDAAGQFRLLYTFTGATDGDLPDGQLMLDAQGNLYGTTGGGGAFGSGTVFKLDPTGKETVIHSFNYYDGISPVGNLARDTSGNIYGTTVGGGMGSPPAGTVFKLDAAGNETVLHNFDEGLDGATPNAGVIRDDGGNLYGTTLYGGDQKCHSGDSFGCGVVFEVTPD